MNLKPCSLLVAGDDSSMRLSLRTIFSNIGCAVVETPRGEEVIALTRTVRFSALLLDTRTSGMDGIEVCRCVRERHAALPIVMFATADNENRKKEAFAAGTNDFILRPFDLQEMVARVAAAMSLNNGVSLDPGSSIAIGDIALDLKRRLLVKDGRPVHLTPKEFVLVHLLMANPGQAVSYATLLRAVRGPGFESDVEYLRTYIYALRKKLEKDPKAPKYLQTLSHVGYCFNDVTGGP
jgi:two-component system KDP operon response regulator KdpE